MISVEEHLTAVMSLAQTLPAEKVSIDQGYGRVLAEDVVARCAVPAFDNSAMDGFAARVEDLQENVSLRVVADIPAGATARSVIAGGECARIMTGAPIPEGADCVVPVELTDQPLGDVPLPQTITVREKVALGKHIRRCGEDVAMGDTVLRAGSLWTPAAAACAASLGHAVVLLHRRPRVAVLATGDELIAPGLPLSFGKIADSNSYLVAGLVQRWGGEVIHRQIVGDDPDNFRAVLQDVAEADLVVTTGGVSVGAYEVVRQVTEGAIAFVKVNMQPGKPQACGKLRMYDGRETAFLGLPGNPVSVWVSAWLFLRPLLAACSGAKFTFDPVKLPVGRPWSVATPRRQYMPVKLVAGAVEPAHALGSGSHLISALCEADGLAIVPAGAKAVGEEVEVLLTR